MISVYLDNKPELLSISKEEALPALESQVLEIFSKLNSTESLVLGLLVEDIFEIQILPFSKFVWRVVIINQRNQKDRQLYYSTQKVIQLIKNTFDGISPMDY